MANPNNPFPPSSLNDFTFSDTPSKQLLYSIVNGAVPFPLQKNAICLWGTNGTGKTTLAELLPTLLETTGNLRASSRATQVFASSDFCEVTSCGLGTNSVTMMAALYTRAKSDVSCSPKGWFYEILDEADLLTTNAQASLKAALSSLSNTIFIFTTNHLSKLDKGVIDRCHLIEMNQPLPIDMEHMGRRFLRLMGLTGNEIPTAMIHQFAATSRGSIRDFGEAVCMEGLKHGGVIP